MFSTSLVIIIAVTIIVAGILTYAFFSFNKKVITVKEITDSFSYFAENFSPDPVNNQSVIQKSHSLLKDVELAFAHFENTKKIQEYFFSMELTQLDLVHYLQVVHAFQVHCYYYRKDNVSAERLLIKAKKIAENYIQDRSTVTIDFDDLEPEELHKELSMINDILEMYTKIIYTLGIAIIHQKDYDRAYSVLNCLKNWAIH